LAYDDLLAALWAPGNEAFGTGPLIEARSRPPKVPLKVGLEEKPLLGLMLGRGAL